MHRPSTWLVARLLPFSLLLAGCPSSTPGDASVDGATDTAIDSSPPPDVAGDTASDGGPVRPPECEEITLTTPMISTQMINSEAYAVQPDIVATASVGGSTGDAANPNDVFFYLDSDDVVGTYPVAPFTSYYYARPNGGGVSTDYVAGDGGTAGYSHRWMAVSGTIQITTSLTPHQTVGTVSNVRFEEATRGSDGSATLVPGGSCYWLRSASWDTRRPHGCAPFTTPGTCPSGTQCMPTNAIGDDGLCAAVGTLQEGDMCTHTDGTWDSDCAPGLRCAYFTALGETGYSCHRLCDVRSTSPACPSDTHCGGGYNVCMPVSYLSHDGTGANEIDTLATAGAVCAQNATALYCGAASQPGTCHQDTGASSATCRPWVHAGSECAGQYGGYVAYKTGIDLSTLFCFH